MKGYSAACLVAAICLLAGSGAVEASRVGPARQLQQFSGGLGEHSFDTNLSALYFSTEVLHCLYSVRSALKGTACCSRSHVRLARHPALHDGPCKLGVS